MASDSSTMPNVNDLVDCERLGPLRPSELAFRVVSCAYGSNSNTIRARKPGAFPTFGVTKDHLYSKPVESPWLSVFVSWAAALRYAQRLRNRGVTRIWIVVFAVPPDLDALAIDAEAFLDEIGGQMDQSHRHEVLIPCGFHHGWVIAMFPTTGAHLSIPVSYGRMKIPRGLIDVDSLTEPQKEIALRRWVLEEVKTRAELWNDEWKEYLTLDIMEAMCN